MPPTRPCLRQPHRVAALLAPVVLAACSDTPTTLRTSASASANALAVTTDSAAGLSIGPALVVTFAVANADSAVAVAVAADGATRTSAPVAVVNGAAHVTLVGLHAGTQYVVTGAATRGGALVASTAPDTVTTTTLPSQLQGTRLTFTAGRLDRGYMLVPVSTGVDNAYAVAFDTTGAIAWYRKFTQGPGIYALGQQSNGHFTAFVGPTNGPEPGAYYEFTADGTVVHTWAAPAGYVTDNHEIALVFGPDGTTTAAYLFGRRSVTMDLSGHGGGVNGSTQTNTVFRLAPDGQATALFTGTDRFTAADWISPTLSSLLVSDFDHPNALQLTPDGGFLVSWRNLKAITKHGATGAFEWQLGGRQATLQYVGDPLGDFDGQHYIRLLPNGHITFFDNGQLHNPQESRGIEAVVDATAATATVVRIDHNPNEKVFSPYQSAYQRLANGNGVLSYSFPGRVTEFDAGGSIVWDGRVETGAGAPVQFYRALRMPDVERYATP